MKYTLFLMLFLICGCHIQTDTERKSELIQNFEKRTNEKYPNYPGNIQADIYFEGFYAGENGFDFNLNPYQRSYDRAIWLNGWMDAKKGRK